eukprot:CAMPEP_0194029528 /NCGR_PEP_ID=MMETSP0009_2-20130614/3225_1 /TAXON_ID=210454 /ORGANISM="Grammatophora oceanica, Strain CCMP 410" /LENGTH=385 /DNA_ID=CAMNT_0038669219 /DNA_START=113 /DNA_END=1270 /DNA_ORIENTATION=+
MAADVVDTPLSVLLFDENWDLARRRIRSHPEDVSKDQINLNNIRLACNELFREIPIDVLELMLKYDRILFEAKKVERLAACSPRGDLATSPLLTCIVEHGQGPVEKVREALELFIKYAPEAVLETSSEGRMGGFFQRLYHGSLEGFGIMHYMVLDFPFLNVQGELRTSELQKEHMAMWKLLVDAKPELLFGNPALVGRNETPFQLAMSHVREQFIMCSVRDETKEKALMYSLYDRLIPLRQVKGSNFLHRFAAFSKATLKQLLILWVQLPTLGSSSMREQQDEDGNTPVHVALLRNQIDISKLLCSSEAMNVANKKGEFPLDLYLAAKCGHETMIHLVNSCPSAFNRLSISDSVYPFLFAKVKPNAVYELVMSVPSLVRRGDRSQ